MNIPINLPPIGKAVLTIDPVNEASMNAHHFRGPEKAVTGNFCRWNNVEHMFDDIYVLKCFMEDIIDGALNGKKFNSVCIDYGCDGAGNDLFVGWSCTDPIDKHDLRHLQRFNKRISQDASFSALRVKPCFNKKILAPRTACFTIAYELRQKKKNPWRVRIDDIYPGENHGPLRDDVTAREKLIFFEENHPGEIVLPIGHTLNGDYRRELTPA